ncbi:MAG: hypothetical protein DMF64_06815 [Acidobacteria bacterium]|nr:MAG: hypothetical protein DMF64_06815 [Acidobacteriota bacterium]
MHYFPNTCASLLEPISLAFNYGFRGCELSEIAELVRQHRAQFLEAWNEHFGEEQS